MPWVTKNGPNIYGWNCRAASTSHSKARAICRPRRPGTGTSSCTGRALPPTRSESQRDWSHGTAETVMWTVPAG